MIRAIVVDDQKSFLRMFREMAESNFADRLELLSACSNIREAVHAIRTYDPELVFLDVEMGSESGFDLLEQMKGHNFEVIFTTAHEHYAIKAIRFSAIDFLLKPFGPEELRASLDRFESGRDSKTMYDRMEQLHQNLKALSDPIKKMAIPLTHGYEVVPLRDIVHLSSSNNYTIFHLSNGAEHVATHPLREYEDMLSEYNFFRVHQSHIINMDHVKTYSRIDGGKVLLSNGTEVEISRRKKDDFLKRLSQVIR